MKREVRIKLKKAKRIDNHTHLSMRPESNAKIEYLQESMKKNGIDFSIVLAAYFPRKTGSITNEQILSLTEKYDNILVFGSMDIENEFEEGISELEDLLAKEKIVGIKLYPGYQYFYPNDEKLNAVYELASKFKVPVMFHSGLAYKSPGGIQFSRPIYIDDVAGNFRDVKFVISHLGDPDTKEAAAVAHKNPNVYLDFSGLVSNTTKNKKRAAKWQKFNQEYVVKIATDVFIDLMGVEKIIFGSDWPISSHEKSLELILKIQRILELDEKEMKQIMSENIMKALGIIK